MLQDLIRLNNVNRLLKSSLICFLKRPLNAFNGRKINKPLYSFTLPGFVLGTSGLYMSLDFIQTLHHGGSFNFEHIVLIALLILVGTAMAFMGVLLHSIAGMIRYKANVS